MAAALCFLVAWQQAAGIIKVYSQDHLPVWLHYYHAWQTLVLIHSTMLPTYYLQLKRTWQPVYTTFSAYSGWLCTCCSIACMAYKNNKNKKPYMDSLLANLLINFS